MLHDHCGVCGARVVRSFSDPTVLRHAYVCFQGHDATLCDDVVDHEHEFTPPHPYPAFDLMSGQDLAELPASDAVL